MPYTSQYTLQSFDATTGRLTVNVEILNGATVVSTQTHRITLPVDENGNVPTGSSLDSLVRDRINRENKIIPTAWAIPTTGVTNASDILDETDIIEAYSGIPILVIPVDPVMGVFSASVMVAAGEYLDVDIERSTLPTPASIVPGANILDNGNVDGGIITSLRGVTDTTGPYVNNIQVSWDYAGSVPSEVVSAYPYVFVDPLPEGADFNEYLTYFYVTHSPISITGAYGIGVFIYS